MPVSRVDSISLLLSGVDFKRFLEAAEVSGPALFAGGVIKPREAGSARGDSSSESEESTADRVTCEQAKEKSQVGFIWK